MFNGKHTSDVIRIPPNLINGMFYCVLTRKLLIKSVRFASVYTVEAFLKIVGLGLRKYFLSGWNM